LKIANLSLQEIEERLVTQNLIKDESALKKNESGNGKRDKERKRKRNLIEI